MGDTSKEILEKQNKNICFGILAHVDAGKTTLSEAMLYTSGSIRRMGRVDNRDAFLDTYELERARGITIFSKQARMEFEGRQITLLDTPGHVDFSAEMERTLQVLDYAILVISGADGVQGHTRTLWRLLAKYEIPVFLFVNKMDQPGTDKPSLLMSLQKLFDDSCVDFTAAGTDEFYENVAMCGETALEQFLENGYVEREEIRGLIQNRRLFPCFFGSALKLKGVEEFLRGLVTYAKAPVYPEEFGARIFKVARDGQGNRLTYLKITGGSLKVRTNLPGSEEKVNQIRVYSGEKFESVTTAEAGCVCAITGPVLTRPGQGLGVDKEVVMPLLEPVLTYQVKLPAGCEPAVMLPKLRQIEEEEPQLHVAWDERLQEIQVQMMGEVQIEILKSMILERFGVQVEFGTGNIVYKETIADSVEGVGHFEPLRHYAEVHLLLEPGERGSGLHFGTACSEDLLDRNWQRLVLTHLEEKTHVGVLTGSPITDMKITLAAGRAHKKHTEGGDFRQATYRARRQGLMQAKVVLLEPWYDFRLEVPESTTGRAMMDIEKRNGTFTLAQSEGGVAVLTGSAPVASMRDYQIEVTAYTKGLGRLFCTLKGYEPCHNTEDIVAAVGYDPERDEDNPTGSVFCSHGAGFTVSWDRVKEYMHLEGVLTPKAQGGEEKAREAAPKEEIFLGTEEVDAILARTFNANKRDKSQPRSGYGGKRTRVWEPSQEAGRYQGQKKEEPREEYLLVDGYNIIYAWPDLRELAQTNLDGARGALLDQLCNYQAVRGCSLIAVFDAYRIVGHPTEVLDYHNIHVVYTKEAETADQYIERFAHENRKKYQVSVATSDGLEQIIIRGQGCKLISARELREEMDRASHTLREEYLGQQPGRKNYLGEKMPDELKGEM